MATQLIPVKQGSQNVDSYRASTDAASICRDIVIATAKTIQGRKYVCVEGWMAIAVAHGCAASADHVERVSDEGMSGFKCTGIVRRMSDGAEIARAEGFLGDDEKTWSGRPVYARRAMVQTRAISRACRSAFAHVVVMIDAGLSTTPAEEVPLGGFDEVPGNDHPQSNGPAPRAKLAQKEGEHDSKTALKNAIHKVANLVRAAETTEAIDSIKAEHKRPINQALRDWPELINGDPGNEDDVGLKGLIERRKAELEGAPGDGAFDGFIEGLLQCETLKALSGYVSASEGYIETLDDVQRRAFERHYDQRESAIKLLDQHQ